MWSIAVTALVLSKGLADAQSASAVDFGVSGEGDKSSHKVSVEVETKDGSPVPYFATFDSTNYAYHWESSMVDTPRLKEGELPVFDANLLSPERIEELLKQSQSVEDDGVLLDANIDPKKVFHEAKLFEEASPFNIGHFLQRGRAFVMFVLCDCPRDTRVARALPRLEELIRNAGYHELYSFMYLYPPAAIGFQLYNVFELSALDVPALIIDNIQVGANLEKYRYPALMSNDPKSVIAQSPRELFEFIAAFQHRMLPLLVRSAPVPDDHEQVKPGKVKEVVASTFESVVLDPGKNVFLFVYSPRCGGSTAAQPVIAQVAEEVRDDPDILIARMDGTRNDFPVRGITLTHFPSAFYFPRGPTHNEDGSLRHLNWDEYNGSKTPHNANVPHSHYEKNSIVDFLRGKEVHDDHVH